MDSASDGIAGEAVRSVVEKALVGRSDVKCSVVTSDDGTLAGTVLSTYSVVMVVGSLDNEESVVTLGAGFVSLSVIS